MWFFLIIDSGPSLPVIFGFVTALCSLFLAINLRFGTIFIYRVRSFYDAVWDSTQDLPLMRQMLVVLVLPSQ